MCHGNRAATFPRNYAGIDGVEGARGPAAAAQGEMLTVPAPYISTRHRTAPVTETPGKQPSKQLSRQESQQELKLILRKATLQSWSRWLQQQPVRGVGESLIWRQPHLSQAPPQVQQQPELRSPPCWCRSTLSSAPCSPPPPPSSWSSHPGGSRARRSA